MEKSENQKFLESLIEYAGCVSKGVKLHEYRIYDLVERLNRSVMGSMHFAEVMSGKLSQKSKKICKSAILYWVKDDIDGKAESANTTVQLITPFLVASIGSVIGVFAWVFNNSFGDQYYLFSFVGVLVVAILFSLARYKCSRDRDTYRLLSNRTEALLKIVQNSNQAEWLA